MATCKQRCPRLSEQPLWTLIGVSSLCKSGCFKGLQLFPVNCVFSLALILCSGLFLGLKEAVKCESVTEATLGEEANFSCDFLLPMDVFQVTWQKINGSSFQNIATYSQTRGLRLIGSFRRKARFARAALNTSVITLKNLTFEDVSCYRCIFNVFPHGSFSSKAMCLNIQSKFSTCCFSLSGMQYRWDGVRGRWNAIPSIQGNLPHSSICSVDILQNHPTFP